MIGYYNYTVVLTYMSLISALYGTHMAFQGNYVNALLCLMMCGIFDTFDGMVARSKERTHEEKRFGIQIDSLVDMFSFGIFPIIIGYSMRLKHVSWFIVFALYAICAVSRLGYFNVQEKLRQQQTCEKRRYYQGLPVTCVALVLPAIYLITSLLDVHFINIVYGIFMCMIAIAFVIDFKVIKPSLKGIFLMSIIGIIVMIGLIML